MSYEEKYGRQFSSSVGRGSSRDSSAAAAVSRKRGFSQVDFEQAPQMTREYFGPKRLIGPSLPPGFVRSSGTQCLPIVTLAKQASRSGKEQLDAHSR